MVGVTAVQKVNPARVPVPPAVTTLMLPLVPAATTAVMVLSFTTEKEAAFVPPNLTDVAPVKELPLIVTVIVVPALVGEKELMEGAAVIRSFFPPLLVIPAFDCWGYNKNNKPKTIKSNNIAFETCVINVFIFLI